MVQPRKRCKNCKYFGPTSLKIYVGYCRKNRTHISHRNNICDNHEFEPNDNHIMFHHIMLDGLVSDKFRYCPYCGKERKDFKENTKK